MGFLGKSGGIEIEFTLLLTYTPSDLLESESHTICYAFLS